MKDGGHRAPVRVDGASLDLAQFVAVARHGARVEVADWSKLEAARRWIEAELASRRSGATKAPIYGVTTGFGSSRNVLLSPEDLAAAQLVVR